MGTLRSRPPAPWLSAFSRAATARLHDFSPQELSNALLGLARLWPSPPTPASGPASSAPEPSTGVAERSAGQPGASVGGSQAGGRGSPGALGHKDVDPSHQPLASPSSREVAGNTLFDAWLDAAEARMVTSSSEENRQLMGSSGGSGSFGAWSRSGDGSYSRAYLEVDQGARAAFNAQELCNVLFAVATLRLRPSPGWVARMLAALRGGEDGGESSCMWQVAEVPRQAAMAAWALRELRITPDAEWLAAFEAATEPRRRSAVGSMEITSLLLAFAGWRHQLSARWLVGLGSRVRKGHRI